MASDLTEAIVRSMVQDLFALFVTAYLTSAVWILVPLFLVTAISGRLRYGATALVLATLVFAASHGWTKPSLGTLLLVGLFLALVYLPAFAVLLLSRSLVSVKLLSFSAWRILSGLLAAAIVGVYLITTSTVGS